MKDTQGKTFEAEKLGLTKAVEEKLRERGVCFIEEKSVVPYEELEAIRQKEGGDKQMYVCDFYVEDIDKPGEGSFDGASFTKGKVVNIDHHSDEPSMKRFISSANLALDTERRKIRRHITTQCPSLGQLAQDRDLGAQAVCLYGEHRATKVLRQLARLIG